MKRVVESIKLPISLKNGAIFIADSHYKKGEEDLYYFLLDIYNKKIETSQLFLVGDIFELMIWNFKYLVEYNKKLIEIINKLSLKIDVFYFEGNHDFLLSSIFPNIKIYRSLNIDSVCISHGDLNSSDFLYKVYSFFIRNRVILFFLNIISLNFINNWVFKRLLNRKKVKCRKFDNFKRYLENNLKFSNKCKFFIEGHYHQNRQFNIKGRKYLNLPAFTCNNCYLILKLENSNIQFLTKEYKNERR